MSRELLLLLGVLVLAAVLAALLFRKARQRNRRTLTLDFRKAKEHERRKNRDLSAYP